jgi:hypothetical protein
MQRSYTRHPASDAALAEPRVYDLITGEVSGGYGRLINDQSARTTFRVAARRVARPHVLTAGVEFEDNRLTQDQRSGLAPNGGQGIIGRYDDSTYLWIKRSLQGVAHNRVLTLHLADSWRAARSLTVDAGLRWDAQRISGPGGLTALEFTDLWQPRLAVTWAPRDRHDTRTFLGAGRSYEQFPLNLAGHYMDRAQVMLLYSQDPRVSLAGEDTVLVSRSDQRPQRDLRGQGVDEFVAGHGRKLSAGTRLEVRGTFRRLAWAIEDHWLTDSAYFVLGNPGRGRLAHLPRAWRESMSLTLTLERQARSYDVRFTYVLSRVRGSYAGLYDYAQLIPYANTTEEFDYTEQLPNSSGLLPYDRTHQVKALGTLRPWRRVSIGFLGTSMSGLPRNELGGTVLGPPIYAYLQPRGSVGRTSTLWDLNARVRWDAAGPDARLRPTFVLDLLHIGNPRTATLHDDVHYFAVDPTGNQTSPNPNYNQPVSYQPPMTARAGMIVAF